MPKPFNLDGLECDLYRFGRISDLLHRHTVRPFDRATIGAAQVAVRWTKVRHTITLRVQVLASVGRGIRYGSTRYGVEHDPGSE